MAISLGMLLVAVLCSELCGVRFARGFGVLDKGGSRPNSLGKADIEVSRARHR